MLPSAISDQKRLVRERHWERARYYLRVRDRVHNKPWNVLIIAGPVPHEEITCIKKLMKLAVITAVDIDEQNALAAIDAGADEVYCMDIGAIKKIQLPDDYNARFVPPHPFDELEGENRFDAICLDLTGPADDWLSKVVQVYFNQALTPKGVMLVTFSYGRDVIEVYDYEWDRHKDLQERLKKMPERIAMRVAYLLKTRVRCLRSCVQYRGGRMPMISLLLEKYQDWSYPDFICIEEQDCVEALEEQMLISSVATRILSNRQTAAKKAVKTKQIKKQVTLLLEGPKKK